MKTSYKTLKPFHIKSDGHLARIFESSVPHEGDPKPPVAMVDLTGDPTRPYKWLLENGYIENLSFPEETTSHKPTPLQKACNILEMKMQVMRDVLNDLNRLCEIEGGSVELNEAARIEAKLTEALDWAGTNVIGIGLMDKVDKAYDTIKHSHFLEKALRSAGVEPNMLNIAGYDERINRVLSQFKDQIAAEYNKDL